MVSRMWQLISPSVQGFQHPGEVHEGDWTALHSHGPGQVHPELPRKEVKVASRSSPPPPRMSSFHLPATETFTCSLLWHESHLFSTLARRPSFSSVISAPSFLLLWQGILLPCYCYTKFSFFYSDHNVVFSSHCQKCRISSTRPKMLFFLPHCQQYPVLSFILYKTVSFSFSILYCVVHSSYRWN
jgi:hypothetical protein